MLLRKNKTLRRFVKFIKITSTFMEQVKLDVFALRTLCILYVY